MKHSKYKHVLTIGLSEPAVSFTPFAAVMNISTAKDRFELRPESLTFFYERSRRQSPEKALNPTRIKGIQNLWTLYYAMTGQFPAVKKATLTIDSVGSTTIEPNALPNTPICMSTLQINGRNWRISSKRALALYKSEYALDRIASITYVYASQQTKEPISRFRLLWSSFNCLYSAVRRVTGCRDRDSIELLIKRLDDKGRLNAARRAFSKQVAPEIDTSFRWGDFIKGYHPLCGKDELVERILANATLTILKSLMSRRAYKESKGILKHHDKYQERLRAAEKKLDGDSFIFVMVDYLYWLRCDTVHGESMYPLYSSKAELRLMEGLCNVLEIIILVGIINLDQVNIN